MVPERNLPYPDEAIGRGFFGIRPDDQNLWGCRINDALEKTGRPERFRIIVIEDRIIAEGIWTQEEAIRITDGITLGTDSNSGERNFITKPEDYEYLGETEDNCESFKVDPEVIKILLASGIFERKRYGSEEEYILVYPEEFKEDGISVEMTHSPSTDVPGKETVTLHF